MWERFTEHARQVIYYSQVASESRDVRDVTPEHVLLGILRETDSFAGKVLVALGVDRSRLQTDAERSSLILPRNPWVRKKHEGEDRQLSERGKRMVDLSYHESRSQPSEEINTGHLLLGILLEGGKAGAVLQRNGVTVEAARAALSPLGCEKMPEGK